MRSDRFRFASQHTTNTNPAVDRVVACEGKQAFDSHSLAERIAKRIKRRANGGSYSQVSVYRCGFCNKFHVGNTPFRMRKPKS